MPPIASAMSLGMKSVDYAEAGLAGGALRLYPAVGPLETGPEGCGGLPFEDLLDEGVVGVAARDAFGRVELVGAPELDSRDLLGQGDEMVDLDELGGAEVDGRGDQLVAVGDH